MHRGYLLRYGYLEYDDFVIYEQKLNDIGMSASNVPEQEGDNRTLKQHTPALAYCPTCSKTVVTEVQISYSKVAHITCVLCLLFGCLFGCCLLPYFSMCFVTAKHYCPDCGEHLASYNPILQVLH